MSVAKTCLIVLVEKIENLDEENITSHLKAWLRLLKACLVIYRTWDYKQSLLASFTHTIIGPVKQIFLSKMMIIYLFISLNMCFGCSKEPSHWDSKNRLIEKVLLSTHNICFGWEIKKIIFSYTLLSVGQCTMLYPNNYNLFETSADPYPANQDPHWPLCMSIHIDVK